jgi:hypothetical protein
MYAIAATAAGVGVALAQPSEAKIVYSPAHKHLPIHLPFYLDLNHDRINDFKFVLDWFTTSGASIVELLVYPSRQGNGIWGQQIFSGLSCADALPRGTRIGPKRPFGKSFLFMFEGCASSSISMTIGWRPIIGAKARPLSARKVERTPQRLERGRYIFMGLSGCAHCHSPLERSKRGFPPVMGMMGSGQVLVDEAS